MTALVTFVASKANSSGQIATPDAARPAQQVVLGARGGDNPQDGTERLQAPREAGPLNNAWQKPIRAARRCEAPRCCAAQAIAQARPAQRWCATCPPCNTGTSPHPSWPPTPWWRMRLIPLGSKCNRTRRTNSVQAGNTLSTTLSTPSELSSSYLPARRI